MKSDPFIAHRLGLLLNYVNKGERQRAADTRAAGTLPEDNRPDSKLNRQLRPFEMCGLSRGLSRERSIVSVYERQ